ncbi:MAG: type III pantothenate kinase [Phycisphaerales bacterium]|nr:type III pantothenate kinase [Phycisphaerales bacterium]
MNIVAVNIGNTNTRFAAFSDEGKGAASGGPSRAISTSATAELARAIADLAAAGESPAPIVIASVNEPAARALTEALAPLVTGEVYRVGVDLPIPMECATDEPAKTGQDRLLGALAAYEAAKQACVVIDAGTAITIDFVDGAGVFQGGAIAPGARMMLRALHRGTAALPEVELALPDDQTFGKNTQQAMLQGVVFGIRGMVRGLVERYAEAYQAYPLVIATGGDAELLFGGDDLVERIVPDLILQGIVAACRRALEPSADTGEE